MQFLSCAVQVVRAGCVLVPPSIRLRFLYGLSVRASKVHVLYRRYSTRQRISFIASRSILFPYLSSLNMSLTNVW